jgi:quinolinate synthase
MLAATSLAEEILELKRRRKAVLLAHHYQEPEIQELAE